MDYNDLRNLHIATAHLSVAGFALRGIWMLRDSPLLATRWARTLPHINDAVLLTAAIGLAVWSQQAPWALPWLTAKIGGLLAYIGLGMVALKPGRPKGIRAAAWLAALFTFAWMLSVARLRDPAGFFGLL